MNNWPPPEPHPNWPPFFYADHEGTWCLMGHGGSKERSDFTYKLLKPPS